MTFYVYILQSLSDFSFYRGYTEDPIVRLQRHNNGESEYTSRKVPWKLVHLEYYASKREALIREKSLKTYSQRQIAELIASTRNGLDEYLGDSGS